MNELDQKDYWYPRNPCTKSMESCPLVMSHILAEFHPERATYTTYTTVTVGFVNLLSTRPIHIVVWENFPFKMNSLCLCDTQWRIILKKCKHLSRNTIAGRRQFICQQKIITIINIYIHMIRTPIIWMLSICVSSQIIIIHGLLQIRFHFVLFLFFK